MEEVDSVVAAWLRLGVSNQEFLDLKENKCQGWAIVDGTLRTAIVPTESRTFSCFLDSPAFVIELLQRIIANSEATLGRKLSALEQPETVPVQVIIGSNIEGKPAVIDVVDGMEIPEGKELVIRPVFRRATATEQYPDGVVEWFWSIILEDIPTPEEVMTSQVNGWESDSWDTEEEDEESGNTGAGIGSEGIGSGTM